MMSGQYKRTGIYTIGLLIALVAWCIGLAGAQGMQAYSHVAELRYSEEGLTTEQVQSILKAEIQSDEKLIESLVAWEQTSNVTVENEALGRSKQVDLLQLYGEAHTLLPLNKLVGDSLVTEDTNGSIISKKVAYDLWGGLDVIGKSLKYKDTEYIIRGVLDDEVPFVMIQAPRQDEEILFTGLRLKFIGNENIKEQVRMFQGQYGLPEGVMIDLSLQATIWIQLILLPGWAIGLIVLYKLYKTAYINRRQWKVCIIWLVGAILMSIMIVKITQLKIKVPIWLIPNQWSDFEFWVRTWKQIRLESLSISTLPTFVPDLWRTSSTKLLWGASIVSGISFFISGKNLEVKDGNSLFYHILFSIVTSFIAIMISYYFGFELFIIQALWLIWPCYIGVSFITKKSHSN